MATSISAAVKVQRGHQRVISGREYQILRFLSSTTESSTYEVGQITEGCGIRDTDEIVRALYTLEGKSLVEPDPLGDFTSSHWRITQVGKRALGLF